MELWSEAPVVTFGPLQPDRHRVFAKFINHEEWGS